MLGIYNYTVVLTYAALLISFAGIHFCFTGHPVYALICLMISGVMDMFDGKVASTKKNRTEFEKNFGIQIDSMCDLICYGLFPAMMVYHTSCKYPWAVCVCGLYLLCAVIRLSFFNCDEMERQGQTTEERHQYLGMPVTMIALIYPAVYIVCKFLKIELSAVVGSVMLCIVGMLFITPVKLCKPGWGGKIFMVFLGIAEIVLFYFAAKC